MIDMKLLKSLNSHLTIGEKGLISVRFIGFVYGQ